MAVTEQKKSLLKKIITLLLGFGPGIFAIGYTIGTGSVTSMIVAGSKFGMQLLWVLLLSCFFSGILMFAYGNYALITNETALYGFRKHLKYGKFLALLIIVGITFGQWNSLMGILGISANIIFEILALNFEGLAGYQYEIVLTIAVLVIVIFYLLMLVGRYSFFEKILIVFVSLMGFSFILSLFFVQPLPIDVVHGLIPTIPKVTGGKMLVAAFVGTTMASATFLSRPLFIKGKGWTIKNLDQQKKDSITAAILIFVISGTIMAVAAGALYHQGKEVTHVLDMANTLEPVAGKWAVTLFFFGTLSAGLSSIFPCLLIAPLLVADYQSGTLDTNSRQFRLITAIACCVALIGPAFGANPIEIQILSQVFNVFVLPAVVLGIILLLRQKKVMNEYKTSTGVYIGMYGALFFSLVISYNGILGLMNYL
ncbi:Nramp family divalent metal transporter [Flavobacteriaceae bacterium]|nr:Nramp family divalent metal transporter [Flavobacteriaceae bacterium]MDA9887100.1 Nramp family divalent metal transporter [Flavobacteriaceae bacterium]MDB2672276.1 Nramp family divalent metal transporter [Flavobacteriaceae bacterium]MDB4187180.1 Nramp family divalent metal transporter [Flavobacteriaceae bacterium]MDB9823949.1 Nramp family divalent metal transporter [Flavobacteriaceae bacterium]